MVAQSEVMKIGTHLLSFQTITEGLVCGLDGVTVCTFRHSERKNGMFWGVQKHNLPGTCPYVSPAGDALVRLCGGRAEWSRSGTMAGWVQGHDGVHGESVVVVARRSMSLCLDIWGAGERRSASVRVFCHAVI